MSLGPQYIAIGDLLRKLKIDINQIPGGILHQALNDLKNNKIDFSNLVQHTRNLEQKWNDLHKEQ